MALLNTDNAREFGKALMRGNAVEFKLGYTWQNATIAVVKRYDLDIENQTMVAIYLRGYAAGIKNETDRETDAALAYAAGLNDGASEAETSDQLNPG